MYLKSIYKGNSETLLNGNETDIIPNLVYRKDETIVFNRNKNVDLDRIPIWDLGDSLDGRVILRDGGYDSRTDLYKSLRKQIGEITIGEIGIFSRRGCVKAAGEIGIRRGYCKFCTSVGDPQSRVMNPELFWKQVKFLYDNYGIQDFFISDNVFGITLDEVIKFEEAKSKVSVSDDISFRAYSYPTILLGNDGLRIAKGLKKLGIRNVFLGIENFDQRILRLINKEFISLEDVSQTIKILGNAGIDCFLPWLLGLPGESEESLQLNFRNFKKLIEMYGSKKTGQGHIVRMDISPAMPLVGTPWFMSLKQKFEVRKDYIRETGKNLNDDLCPNFNLLRRLNLKYFGFTTEERIFEIKEEFTNVALEHLSSKIGCGAFDFRKKN